MSALIGICVPDIGDFKNVPVLEVLVKPGALVEVETPLLVLETEKATIDVPSPARGKVHGLSVGAGDLVSEGSLMLTLETEATGGAEQSSAARGTPIAEPRSKQSFSAEGPSTVAPVNDQSNGNGPNAFVAMPTTVKSVEKSAYAGPSIRALSRRLGVDLTAIEGSGTRGRILKEDVHAFVKRQLEAAGERAQPIPQSPTAMGWPKIDFEKYGAITRQALSRIQKRSGTALARNWAQIPHVTNFEEADVTDLEAFRLRVNQERSIKVTMLAFLIKASASALRKFPAFNASLDGDSVIRKQYCHIGFAADTPAGLVVPVIRDADHKGLLAIAGEATTLAAQAREGKLKSADMEGGCFSVSSLGGIGGVGFTPIINAPEVAILGAARARVLPRWEGTMAVGRLILPLSLSWDHRVVDGVAAGRFLAFLANQIGDLRRWIL